MFLRIYISACAVAIVACGLAILCLAGSNRASLVAAESLTWRDHLEIQDAVREKTYTPIATMDRIGEARVRVVMCATGCIVQNFVLEKRDGHWRRLY